MEKNIAIAGLGLIGGSMAKSIKSNTKHKIYGLDINPSVAEQALAQHVIDEILDENSMPRCDIIIVCLYPHDTIEFVKQNIPHFKKGSIVIDCAGVKSSVCTALSPYCAEHDVYFIGGHPMAGIEKSGYENSYGHLFDGATMILCKDEYTNIVALKAAEMLFAGIGFLRVTITAASEHDKIIAFTSQLAHVVSNAYIKSPTASHQIGYSAGSYKDLTRVAWMNEKMWTELFFENRENLIYEATELIARLNEYVDALKTDDREKMRQLLYEGKKIKETVG